MPLVIMGLLLGKSCTYMITLTHTHIYIYIYILIQTERERLFRILLGKNMYDLVKMFCPLCCPVNPSIEKSPTRVLPL